MLIYYGLVLEIQRVNNTSFFNNREELPASILTGKYRIRNEYSVIWGGAFSPSILKSDDIIHSQYTNSWVGEKGGADRGGISEAVKFHKKMGHYSFKMDACA